MRRLVGLAVIVVVVALSGCAQTVDQAPPPSATGGLDDLRGTWVGTWGGTPVRLVIVEQVELGERSGVYFGPVQVLGRRRPGVAGVLTSTIAGAPVSANAEGWLGNVGGKLTMLVRATTTAGIQEVTLARTAPDRWTGRGESEFAWGPQGAIEIARRRITTP
jgi:hypothetical protein